MTHDTATPLFSADVGLGHVDEDAVRQERPRVRHPGRLQNLPLRFHRHQHELLLPGELLQEARLQCGAGCPIAGCQ